MNDLGEPLLDLVGGRRAEGVLRMIALDGTRVPNTTGFSGLLGLAHASSLPELPPNRP